MTSRQKQSALYDLQQEKQTLRKLEIVYRDALDSVNEKIAEIDARTDTQNRQSIAYQKQFQESLKNQLEDILQDLAQKSYRTTDEYLKDSYINGCVETVYQMHGNGIPVCMPIPQERVTKAVRLDSSLSKPLYQSVGEDIAQLKKSITDVVARGFATGTSIDDMANQIAGKMIGDYSNMAGGALWRAKLIARTESNRIANAARLDTAKDAKEQTGADLVKQWSSALDARTRPHHIALHGQVRELDEGFEIAGRIGSAPCHFGIASEDCNCRCRANTVPRWAVDEDAKRLPLKDDANYVGIDADGYEEFKGKYLDELKRLGERTESSAEAVDVGIPMPETNGGDGEMYQPEEIGGKALTFGANGGIIEMLQTKDDPMREVLGSAETSHPNELQAFLDYLSERNVNVIRRFENASMGYQPGLKRGEPGQVVMERGASYSAWLHEMNHVKDDEKSGWCGMSLLFDLEKRWNMESDAYDIEIEFAKSIGRDDIVKRLELLKEEERRKIYDE